MIKMRIYWVILILIFPLFLYSCRNGLNIFSPQDDVQLGLQLHKEIRNNHREYPILNDAEVVNYVQNIVNRIIQSPAIKYRNFFKYKVTIIRDDKTVNAFATPGGLIYVYTGLLKFVDDEATLASILAHEIAHSECRHATERLTKAYGVSILLDIILGKNPSQIEEIAANLFTGLAFLKNSRDDEYEADEYAYKYLKSTEWYPGALIFFFEKIKKNDRGSFLEVLLSTHPLSQDRIERLNRMISQDKMPPSDESNLFSKRYANFKRIIP